MYPGMCVLVCLCMCVGVWCTKWSLYLCHSPAHVLEGGAVFGCLVSCEQSPGAEGWA